MKITYLSRVSGNLCPFFSMGGGGDFVTCICLFIYLFFLYILFYVFVSVSSLIFVQDCCCVAVTCEGI